MVEIAAKAYQRGLRQGLKQSDAWNASTCDWVAAANVSSQDSNLAVALEAFNVGT